MLAVKSTFVKATKKMLSRVSEVSNEEELPNWQPPGNDTTETSVGE